jgi:hypothetical protein
MDMMAVETKAKEVRAKQATENETNRGKFLRLAPTRMEAALKKISLVGNLAGAGYEYQAGEVKQLIAALTDAVTQVEAKFTNKKTGKRGGFSFKGSGS